jgi:predicted nuclease of predicted toxin-antitoxin system
VKLLLDTCVPYQAVAALRASGHDATWTGEWPRDPGDEEILASAHREARVLVTLDKDFGELAIVHGTLHSGIVRLVDLRAQEQAAFCEGALARYADVLGRGGIVTVERSRTRVRAAE